MLNEKRINVFYRGGDAIVAVPMDNVDGSLDEAREDIAHIFDVDLKLVVANMKHKDVPPNKFYVWRIKGYASMRDGARLRAPGSSKFMAWSAVNEIEDENLGLVDTSSGAVAKGLPAYESAKPKTTPAPASAPIPEESADGDDVMIVSRAEWEALVAEVKATRADITTLAMALNRHASAVEQVLTGRKAISR